MDWLAAARLHPIDQVFTRGSGDCAVVCDGFHKETFGFYLVIATLQAIFIHSNVRLKFGEAPLVNRNARIPHWHHSNDPEAYNKNFSGQLPLLDWIFGTAHMPKGKMPETYGTYDPVPTSYIKQMMYPFQPQEKLHTAGAGTSDYS